MGSPLELSSLAQDSANFGKLDQPTRQTTVNFTTSVHEEIGGEGRFWVHRDGPQVDKTLACSGEVTCKNKPLYPPWSRKVPKCSYNNDFSP